MLTFSTSKFSYIRYYSVANCKNGCYITFHIICFIIYLPLFVCACYEPVGAIKLCKSKTTTCKLLCVMNFEMDFGENQFQNFRFQNFNLANLVYLFSSWNTEILKVGNEKAVGFVLLRCAKGRNFQAKLIYKLQPKRFIVRRSEDIL